MRYAVEPIGRHLHWARTQGLRRLLEEDDLDPVQRASRKVAKWRWRRAHGSAPGRPGPCCWSGCNARAPTWYARAGAPEFEVYNENHSAAFDRFQLRPIGHIRGLLEASRHPYVLLKPFCDAHRTPELLEALRDRVGPRGPVGLPLSRGPARSAVAKFGDQNLGILRELPRPGPGPLAGPGTVLRQPRGADRAARLVQRRHHLEAALFWYVRNRLYFELGLEGRPDVLLVSYDAMVADPAAEMRQICGFLDFPYHPRLVAGITARPPASTPAVALQPQIAACCAELAAELEAARREQATTTVQCASCTSTSSSTAVAAPRATCSTWPHCSAPRRRGRVLRDGPPRQRPGPHAATPPLVRRVRPAAGRARRRVAAGRMIWSRRGAARDGGGAGRVPARRRPRAQHLPPAVALGGPRGRRRGIPVVLTMHDYKLACPTYQFLDHGRPAPPA